MPLCGIVLPPSKTKRILYHAVLSCGPSSFVRVTFINLIIQIDPIVLINLDLIVYGLPFAMTFLQMRQNKID